MGFLKNVFGQSGVVSNLFDITALPFTIRALKEELLSKTNELATLQQEVSARSLEVQQCNFALHQTEEELVKTETTFKTIAALDDASTIIGPICAKLDTLKKQKTEEMELARHAEEARSAAEAVHSALLLEIHTIQGRIDELDGKVDRKKKELNTHFLEIPFS